MVIQHLFRARLYNLSDMKRENGVLRVDRAEQSFNVYARDNYAQAVTFAMSRDTSGWARCAVASSLPGARKCGCFSLNFHHKVSENLIQLALGLLCHL
jgi:hypothetical protein